MTDDVQQTEIERAVALGWHVSEIYHVPKVTSAAGHGTPAKRLPGVSSLNPTEQALLLARQVGADIRVLLPTPAGGRSAPSTEHLESLLGANPPDDHSIRLEIWNLHINLLEALTVSGFRVGKAYGLGRALSETAIVPVHAPDAERIDVLKEVLRTGRCLEIVAWLAELKTSFRAHAAYAAEGSLMRWSDWDNVATLQDDGVFTALSRQGRVWRSLLTGELQATDLLQATDFVVASIALLKRVSQLARRFVWSGYGLVLLLVLIVVVGGLIGISQIHSLDRTNQLIAQLVTAVAALGVTTKGVLSTLGRAAAKAEQPLWQSELDESCAVAASRLPYGVAVGRRPRADIGSMEWGGSWPTGIRRLIPRSLRR